MIAPVTDSTAWRPGDCAPLAALPRAIAQLDRGERAAALDELRRTTASFQKGGHAELLMTDYIKWLDAGTFGLRIDSCESARLGA